MKTSIWKTYGAWIVLSEAVGGLSGFLTRHGMQVYEATVTKPPLTPPNAVFPVVWGILFALMGIGAAKVYLAIPSRDRSRALQAFLAQLVVNFFWSILFFNIQAFGFAFYWLLFLWLLIFWMIASFRKVNPPAAWLQIPYLLWVTFAAYLNFGVWMLNR